MMSLEHMENEAIGFIVEHAKEPYRLYFSGGRGSCVVRHLLLRSGVPYTGTFRRSGHELNELTDFISQFGDITMTDPERALLQMVGEREFLPTPGNKYCCADSWNDLISAEGSVGIRGVTRKPGRIMTRTHRDRSGRIANIDPILEWDEDMIRAYIEKYSLITSPEQNSAGQFSCIVCPLHNDISAYNFNEHMAIWSDRPEQLQMQRDASDRSYEILKAKNYPILAKDKDEYFKKWCCKEKLVGGVESIVEVQNE